VAKGSVYLTTPPCPPTREPDLALALEVVGADVYARAQRLAGRDVRLVAASLDQGRGVERRAYERGGTPQHLVDHWAERWQAALEALDVEHDDRVRTAEARHQRVVKALFLKLFDQGDIYKGTREGRYCARCEEFAADGQPPPDACAICHEALTDAAEEAYFLRASKYRKAVAEQLDDHPDLIQPAEHHHAILEAIAEHGIADLCISRPRHEWSIAVPIDPDLAIDAWFDALVSYLTGSGYLADPQMFERYWPPRVQVVARESLRLHALAWPAILTSLGLALPQRLVVRGELAFDDTGAGPPGKGAAGPAAFAARFGADAVRHGLLRATDYTADGHLSPAKLVDLYNEHLVEGFGRLVETTLMAIEGLREGRVPRPGPFGAAEEELVEQSQALFGAVGALVEAFDFRGALDRVGNVVHAALRYAEQGGLVAASDRASGVRRLDTALYVLAETSRLIAHNLSPFLPAAAAAVVHRFGVDPEGHTPDTLARWGITQPQTCIRRGERTLPPLAATTD